MTELTMEQEKALEAFIRSCNYAYDAEQLMETNLRELTGGSELPETTFDPETSTFTVSPPTPDAERAARIITLDVRRRKYQQKQTEIKNAIDALPNDEEKLVIRLRYLYGLDMQSVADKMRRSRSHAFSLRKSALLKLHDFLGEYI